MSRLEQAITDNFVPWRNIEHRTKHYWVFTDKSPITEGHLLFVPTEETAENLWQCYQAAYKFGFNGVERQQWEAFSIEQKVGEAAGQTVMYPHVHMIPVRRSSNITTD